MTPTTITQPRTTREPSIRLERDEQRVAAAHEHGGPEATDDGDHGRQCGGSSNRGRAERVVRRVLCYHPPSRPALVPCRAPVDHHTSIEVPTLAKTPRTWTGARTPSGLKRVRQAESRHEVLQPRRSAAKTYVAKALTAAAQPAESTIDPVAALAEALSALDRAAKAGAIHPNAAARRKSRLTRKVNAALGGAHVQTGGRVAKTTGKAAAAKAAKARIAAGKAGKAKGAQTAAGKARAALSKTARAEAAAAKAAAAEASAASAEAKPAAREADRPRPPRPRRPRRAAKKPAATAKAAAEGRRPRPAPKPRRPRPRSRLGSLAADTLDAPGSAGAFRIRGLARGRSGGRVGPGSLVASRLRAEDAVERRAAQAADVPSGRGSCRHVANCSLQ